ncbi:MAG: FtsX-like permease family protein [Acidobacteria bacterium]|nr:MAG: FtsX-like permease family protein [Acidobacteriota bacterium]
MSMKGNTISQIKEPVLIALEAIRSQKLRAGLTILGVVIGVMAVVAVAAVIHGLNAHVAGLVERLGSQVFFVTRLPPAHFGHIPEEIRKRKHLRLEDAHAIARSCPSVQYATPFRTRAVYFGQPNYVSYRGREMRGTFVRGVEPVYEKVIELLVVEDGRFISELDMNRRRQVCVIGHAVKEALFPQIDPLGKKININGKQFEVIGVLKEDKGLFGGPSLDQFIHIPLTTFVKLYPDIEETFIGVKVADQRLLEQARDEVINVLRRRRGVPADKPNDFETITPDIYTELWNQLTGALVMLTLIISSIGLLVGGIGVMNIMLVSVTERTREIGIRKAVGARRSDILVQFLIEAITLTGVGGVLGIILGGAVSFIVRWIFPSLPTSLSLFWIVVAFTVSVSVGLFFGLYPANKAARLDPIEALRYE